MGKKSRDLPTILNELYDEIFGDIVKKEEQSGVVKIEKIVVDGYGHYGKTGYWVKDLVIHYGWFDSTEEKGWTYCDTRNEAIRVKARNKKLSIEKERQYYYLWGCYQEKHWFNDYSELDKYR